MLKRAFDIFFATLGMILLSPLFIIVYILIRLDSSGDGFFVQKRIGKHGKAFNMIKFRTMYKNADQKELLTIGKDDRITGIGRSLRRYKIDELPQLANVVKGEMSLVGPRPEVPDYVAHYTAEQKEVLNVRPGITDYASIEYLKESQLLGSVENPEEIYLKKIMPNKLRLNLKYIRHQSMGKDLGIIMQTLVKLFQ